MIIDKIEKTIKLDCGTGSIYKFLWEENKKGSVNSNHYIPQIYNVKEENNKLIDPNINGKSNIAFITQLNVVKKYTILYLLI